MGRGASGVGVAVEVAAVIAAFGGASATLYEAARLVRRVYHKMASSTSQRPMISLGAAEHLAIADLIDREHSMLHLVGSGDVNSNSPDRGFTGGDTFFVALSTDAELHSYHISAYGEVYYIGTSPLIRGHWDAPPPYWAGGDAS